MVANIIAALLAAAMCLPPGCLLLFGEPWKSCRTMPGLLLLDCAAGELLLLLGLAPACSSALARAIGLWLPLPAVAATGYAKVVVPAVY
jgi:hypothetical protein